MRKPAGLQDPDRPHRRDVGCRARSNRKLARLRLHGHDGSHGRRVHGMGDCQPRFHEMARLVRLEGDWPFQSGGSHGRHVRCECAHKPRTSFRATKTDSLRGLVRCGGVLPERPGWTSVLSLLRRRIRSARGRERRVAVRVLELGHDGVAVGQQRGWGCLQRGSAAPGMRNDGFFVRACGGADLPDLRQPGSDLRSRRQRERMARRLQRSDAHDSVFFLHDGRRQLCDPTRHDSLRRGFVASAEIESPSRRWDSVLLRSHAGGAPGRRIALTSGCLTEPSAGRSARRERTPPKWESYRLWPKMRLCEVPARAAARERSIHSCSRCTFQ